MRTLLVICLAVFFEAIVLFSVYGKASETKPPRIGVYKERLPGVDVSIAGCIGTALQARGFEYTYIDSTTLESKTSFNPGEYYLLIVPESHTFPASLLKSVAEYAKAGGHIFVLNGPAFTNTCWKDKKGSWVDLKRLISMRETQPVDMMLFDFEDADRVDLSDLRRDTNDSSVTLTVSIVLGGADRTKNSLRYHIENLTAWDTFALPITRRLSPEHMLTTFWAKGDNLTSMIAVEWREKDDSRWIAKVPITTEWKRYVIPSTDFMYWHRSATGNKRGFAGDCVHPENVKLIRIGLALSHTYISQGEHMFWIDEIGVSTDPVEINTESYKPYILDTISPSYKCYPMTDMQYIHSNRIIGDVKLPSHEEIKHGAFSPTWRPQGTGYNKAYNARFIPLLKVYDSNRLWSGTLASMLINRKESRNSIFATLTIGNTELYKKDEILDLVGTMSKTIHRGIFFVEGGSEYFSYFPDQTKVRLGARVINLSPEKKRVDVRMRILSNDGRNILFEQKKKISAGSKDETTFETTWDAKKFGYDKYTVEVLLLDNDEVIDVLTHDITVWKPAEEKNYVVARDRAFVFEATGEPWLPFGLNYMPSSGVALEEPEQFEFWINAKSYDPEIIETDLARVANVLDMNMVSVFIYSGAPYHGNLLDLLCRCKKHNLMVNLSLRPFADPMKFNLQSVREIIESYRLAENDLIFAYDIAWEPWFGVYHLRRGWDKDWRDWIRMHYGNIEDAEKDWGFKASRDENGAVTSPSDHQITNDGAWRVMVAAYRRFVDDLINKKYEYAIRKIKEIDPNHLISFRMSEGGNPLCTQEGYPYDMKSIAKAVDIFEPEGYGRFSPLWTHTRTGIFTTWYGHSLALKPVFWGEFGMNVWSGSNFQQDEILLNAEKEGYENFYRMAYESCSNGVCSWWYPGGFRYGENSDYGALNPDGSTRPIQTVIEKYKSLLTDPEFGKKGSGFKPDYWITVDRDKHVDGIYGIYKEVKDEFWRAFEDGKTVGFRTPGTGCTSANCPLIAIGNRPYTGTNPPKYLNASFYCVKIKNRDDVWEEVQNGDLIHVKKNNPIMMHVIVSNTGNASWLHPTSEAMIGGVYLSATEHSDIPLRIPVPDDVPHFENVNFGEFEISKGIAQPEEMEIRMHAGRAWFGEKIYFLISPE